MSTITTRLRALFDRILDAVADMTPRDRTLLLGLEKQVAGRIPLDHPVVTWQVRLDSLGSLPSVHASWDSATLKLLARTERWSGGAPLLQVANQYCWLRSHQYTPP